MSGAFQIGGLVSGLDTGSIIAKLMEIERQPLLRLQSRQQQLEARKTALSDLSAKLSALKSLVFNLTLSSTTQGRTATSTDAAVATATASASAAIQSFTVHVDALATKTIRTSTGAIGTPLDTSATLANAGFATAPGTGTFTVTVGSTTKTITVTSSSTVSSVLADIAGAYGAETVSASYDPATNKITISTTGSDPVVFGPDSSGFLNAAKLAASTVGTTRTSTGILGVAQASATLDNARLASPVATGDSGSFTINGVQIDWTSSDTINSLITRINGSAANVIASYDPGTDRVTLQAKNTGSTAIDVANVSGPNLLDKLGIASAASQTLGANAQYRINGGATQYSTSNTISEALPGVSLTLVSQSATAVTITIAQDTAAAVKAVKDFVSAFNDALSLLQEQTAIDVAGKTSGIFAGDAFIQGIEFRMRTIVASAATGLSTYTTFASIGVTTGPVGSAVGTTNSLVLDEAKLTDALQQNPEAVTAFLTSASGPVATLNTYLTGLTSATGPLATGQSSADTQINDLDDQIADLEQRLADKQEQLERKFTDLERTMAQLQLQSSQLLAQLGQLQFSTA